MGSMGEQKLFQEPTIVKMSKSERESGVMDVDNVAKAVIALHRDGFVVLENVVDPEHCEVLDKLMCEEADRMKTDPKTIWNDVSRSTVVRDRYCSNSAPRISMLPRRNGLETCSTRRRFGRS